jgi:hypothetical protein
VGRLGEWRGYSAFCNDEVVYADIWCDMRIYAKEQEEGEGGGRFVQSEEEALSFLWPLDCRCQRDRATGSQRPYQLLFFIAIVYLVPSQLTVRAVCTWNFPFFLITEMRGIFY